MPVRRAAQSSSATQAEAVAAEVRERGFSSPVLLLAAAECAALERHAARSDLPAPLCWHKGRAATDPVLHDIATRPEIIALLRPLLGEDIVLWGASFVCRRPGTIHPWHTDMESAAPDSRAISAWIGICNTADGSGLRFIAGSHRFDHPVQEVLARLHVDRDRLTDSRMLEIARTVDPMAALADAGSRDGEMVLFDGRAWHCGCNERAAGTRTALLLQYAAATTPIPMPAGPGHEWPLRFAEATRVPTILVSGSGRHSANRLVPPPQKPAPDAPMISTVARTIALPLADDPVKRWRPYPQFKGRTGALSAMSCHISVLSPGHHPHPPHIHPEEELLLVIDGEVEIELADAWDGDGSRRHRLRPGMFSYYPATQHHTIHNVGDRPATYLMFKWRGGILDVAAPLPTGIFACDFAGSASEPVKPIRQRLLFEQPTHTLGKLHVHLTTLQPGAGYAAHADPYDVAILLFSGEVETIGERVRPFGLVYYSAGELHGMRNVGQVPANYLVFEFHGPSSGARGGSADGAASEAERRRKTDKRRRKRGLRGFLRRLAKAARRLAR